MPMRPPSGRVLYLPGRRAVSAALTAARPATALFLRRGETDLAGLARAQGIRVEWATPERLTEVAGTHRHQGVVLAVEAPPVPSLKELAARRAPDGPLVVALDGLEDPQNVGSVARAAFLAGADLLAGEHAITPGAARASAGALASLPYEAGSVRSFVARAQRAGLAVVVADAERGKAPWDVDLTGPVCVVFGGEHAGVSEHVLEASDVQVRIPTPGGELSLNVASAASILLFERVRQQG